MNPKTYTRVCLIAAFSLTAMVFSGCDLIMPAKQTAPVKKAETADIETPAESSSAAASSETQENQGPLPADMVARVGKWTLSNEEFNQRLKLLKQSLPDFNDKDPQTKATVLNELIRQQLLVKDAESSDIAQQKDIKDALEDFRRTLLVQELAQRLTKGISATEKEAQDYYDQNKNIFLRWKARQIVTEDEAAAKNILVQVLQGGDFAALAKTQSKDKSAAQGGLIEDPAQTPLDVQKNIAALDTGGTSAVFKGEQGFYIVHVDEKSTIPFSEVREELKNNMTLRKQQTAILEHIESLAKKTKVEVNDELLGLGKNK